jgi:hypothetical protein
LSLLALLAIAAASASSTWAAARTTLEKETTTKKTETTSVVKALRLGAEGEPEIECTKLSNDGELQNESAKIKVNHLKFSGCIDISSPTKCEVSTIETKPLLGTLSDGTKSPETKIQIQPVTGEEITSFKLKNKGESSCTTTGALVMRGKITTESANNSSPSPTHRVAINVTSASKELTLAEKPVSASVVIVLETKTRELWSLLS